jgi:hypothetical protein
MKHLFLIRLSIWSGQKDQCWGYVLISRPITLVKKPEYPEKTASLSQFTDKLYHILVMLYRVQLAWVEFELTTDKNKNIFTINELNQVYRRLYIFVLYLYLTSNYIPGHGRNRMLVGFTTTNLGWYCDVTNIFIRQRQIQIVTWNNRN